MSTSRNKISDDVRLAVWVRAGGRCAICKRYLLESELTHLEVRFGELAHNIGQTNSQRSPRGVSDLPEAERDTADNIVLLCAGCHNEIDKMVQLDRFPVDKIRQIKLNHEARIRTATGRIGADDTAILRLSGLIRDVPVDIPAEVAAAAVLATSDRFPRLAFAHDGQGVDLDLREFPDEHAPTALYYQSCVARIDQIFERLIQPAIANGDIRHISVFAMARVPLLVYLGARLDDTVECDVYEPRGSVAPWVWASDSPTAEFGHRCCIAPTEGDTEAVLVINASGTTHALPPELTTLGRYVIEPTDAVPQVGTVDSRATLASFERSLRSLLGELEQSAKHIERLHVIAAAPVSIAVTVGRCVGWGIQPNLVTYDLVDKTYQQALEIAPA